MKNFKMYDKPEDVEDCNSLSCWIMLIATIIFIIGGCVALDHKLITFLFF